MMTIISQAEFIPTIDGRLEYDFSEILFIMDLLQIIQLFKNCFNYNYNENIKYTILMQQNKKMTNFLYPNQIVTHQTFVIIEILCLLF